jgi:glycosyltransferase involved in cell wall biosynthesis
MISVIIATRNRAAMLAQTLEAISRQEPPEDAFEIIVVDNASVDDTPTVVAAAASAFNGRMLYLREPRAGKSYALNTAVTHARGDLLVLTDDDVLPSSGWLVAYVRAFATTNSDFAVGRIFPLWEAQPPRWMSPALYGVVAVPDSGPQRIPIAKDLNEEIMALGGNMALRRHVLERVGGWNPAFGKLHGTLRTGEDHEFHLKMIGAGFKGVYEPDAWVHHRVPANRLRLGYFWRWFFDNGSIVAQLDETYPATPHALLGVPRYLWREFISDLSGMLLGMIALNPQRLVAGGMRASWFAGYLRERWAARRGRRDPETHRTAAQNG